MHEFVHGVVHGKWSDAQAGAMLMALFQKGINLEETRLMLHEMLHSGEIVDLDDVPMPKADKHSTGGVGDKVSLVLAPLAAACGLAIPMLSGRRLGHTGGTLDKLESIPGYNAFLSTKAIQKQVASIGCVIAGQTKAIAPADKILYPMRDETSTVEDASLIAASILSKKLAEGIDYLLLDVKFGRGAFLEKLEEAEALARVMVDLGKAAGCRVDAWLTRMDTPLGRAVGNSVEVEECIAILKGEGPEELTELIVQQVAGMLEMSGIAPDSDSALMEVRAQLHSGAALERFRQMVTAQGGDAGIIENPSLLPRAPHTVEILFEESSPTWVEHVDARSIAEVALEAGANRLSLRDTVDPAAGISSLVAVGDRLEPGDLVARLHHDDEEQEAHWVKCIQESITHSSEPVVPESRIYKKISSQ
jgi:pyrimidine-nucleoside phosphorylase